MAFVGHQTNITTADHRIQGPDRKNSGPYINVTQRQRLDRSRLFHPNKFYLNSLLVKKALFFGNKDGAVGQKRKPNHFKGDGWRSLLGGSGRYADQE